MFECNKIGILLHLKAIKIKIMNEKNFIHNIYIPYEIVVNIKYEIM